jgi:hypothetical protein
MNDNTASKGSKANVKNANIAKASPVKSQLLDITTQSGLATYIARQLGECQEALQMLAAGRLTTGAVVENVSGTLADVKRNLSVLKAIPSAAVDKTKAPKPKRSEIKAILKGHGYVTLTKLGLRDRPVAIKGVMNKPMYGFRLGSKGPLDTSSPDKRVRENAVEILKGLGKYGFTYTEDRGWYKLYKEGTLVMSLIQEWYPSYTFDRNMDPGYKTCWLVAVFDI